MSLHIYNTFTRQKEKFQALHEGRVGIYVCGPTVYDHSHIGHAKSYVSFDVIVRHLRFLSYGVLYVQNITDVGHMLESGEDRILHGAAREGLQPMQVVETYMRSYFDDMDRLGVLRPDISPRASGHVIEQIEMIKTLLAKGYAYEVNGSVYFDVGKFPEYGKLSGRKVDEMETGTRIEVNEEKKHPADFALWKRAEPEHIMQWPSPWGKGFPGWHIECSAMSTKYLGETFDIHGGGIENQFPHHDCEIAQSVGATGHPFVKYWIHNNMVTVNGQKMGKSLGNAIYLKDLFKKYDPLVARFFILQGHYRSTLDFSDEAMDGAKKGLDKLQHTVDQLRPEIAKHQQGKKAEIINLDGYREKFIEAMNDDFNTPQAIAVLFDLNKEVNILLDSGAQFSSDSLTRIDSLYRELGDSVLGIVPEKSGKLTTDAMLSEERLVALLVELRNEARARKDWALSDRIRIALKDLGIVLEDKRDGTVWKRA
jgi:cysteinyl-tRNA synthetase